MYKPFGRILYGGDYNPNQWPKEVWEQDMAYTIKRKYSNAQRPFNFNYLTVILKAHPNQQYTNYPTGDTA